MIVVEDRRPCPLSAARFLPPAFCRPLSAAHNNVLLTCLTLLACPGPLHAASVQAARPVTPLPLTTAQRRDLAWLPPAAQTQSHVFEYLAGKAGDAAPPPAHPKANLTDAQMTAWDLARYRACPDKPPARYTIIYQDLLLARDLLGQPGLTQCRDGMRLAKNAQQFALMQLGDKRLSARITEGFLLPHLGDAYAQKWQDLSRHQIVEAACAAYDADGEAEKRLALLRLYLDMTARQKTDQDDADWARDQLALSLAKQGRYGEAISYLQSIQTANFRVKTLIPAYQREWAKQKQGAVLQKSIRK